MDQAESMVLNAIRESQQDKYRFPFLLVMLGMAYYL